MRESIRERKRETEGKERGRERFRVTGRCPLLGGWKYTESIRELSLEARKLVFLLYCVCNTECPLSEVPLYL